ncbi:MAG TPA: HPF/RaiA family ribosome-associated protein [Kofleriaceae bacterium]|jgi:ribosome-associated translation inhibitor RaiA|nr:HPF/RaiA family ribosome-associated protein [Kofleriaceae bacterium]
MKVDVRWRATDASDALAGYVNRRLKFALARFNGAVQHIVVRFEDVNGPKGGIDKRVTIEATGKFGTHVVEALDSDFHVAADHASAVLKRIVARVVGMAGEHRVPRFA